MPKRNLTIRLDDEMREKLQLVADREMRPLANQIMYFLAQGLDTYIRQNSLNYVPEEGMLLTNGEYQALLDRRRAEAAADIPN